MRSTSWATSSCAWARSAERSWRSGSSPTRRAPRSISSVAGKLPGMSNFGGAEMLVCLFLALIVLGPERLPKVARQAGAVMRQLRQMSSGFQEELRSAIEDPQPKDFSGRLAAVPDTETPELA